MVPTLFFSRCLIHRLMLCELDIYLLFSLRISMICRGLLFQFDSSGHCRLHLMFLALALLSFFLFCLSLSDLKEAFLPHLFSFVVRLCDTCCCPALFVYVYVYRWLDGNATVSYRMLEFFVDYY